MIQFLLVQGVLDGTSVKISAYGPYIFMGLVVAVLAGVGLFRWNHERRRKQSIEREIYNTMSRHEQRRVDREKGKSQR
jgi:hypothetical protein